jgi:hypothetical protein
MSSPRLVPQESALDGRYLEHIDKGAEQMTPTQTRNYESYAANMRALQAAIQLLRQKTNDQDFDDALGQGRR